MFDKILAAIDRSTVNQKVFEEALSLAKANNASLILLHVLSGEESGSPIMSLYPIAKRPLSTSRSSNRSYGKRTISQTMGSF